MNIEIRENILLAPYTIYKIGGPARYLAEVRSATEVEEAVRFAAEKNLPLFVLGAGSNTLVSDRGFDGLVIHMSGGEVKIEGERLVADAGVMMARAVTESARAGLAGFEWGVGVPGTIGGSVRGNAGCFGGEMKDVVESVAVFDATKTDPTIVGSVLVDERYDAARCVFGYRDSIFKRHPEWVIVSATLKLKKGDPAGIQDEVRRITMERSAKQDIGAKSCGCIFKNPAWDREKEKLMEQFPELTEFRRRAAIPAAFLLDRAGMKGRREGGVVVSQKHANFFVNEGGATASDVRALVATAKETVQSLFGVALEEEIQYVGF